MPGTAAKDSHDHAHEQVAPADGAPSRRERFLASYLWLILKNILGWLLILIAMVAGPLVPGPGGIPLFLVGFALIAFPGKRRITARVLRGRPIRSPAGSLAASAAVAVLLGVAVALPLLTGRPKWLVTIERAAMPHAAPARVGLCLAGGALLMTLACVTPRALNLMLSIIAKARRKFRPWLRRHHIRLLPPRWRSRHPHEHGIGRLRLKEEILKYTRKHRR
jgi:hypothetical protein